MIYTFTENKYHSLVENYVERETDYHFSEVLGVGSYGVAYLLIHKNTGKKFVLKRMKIKHKKSHKLKKKFEQEILMLKEIGLPCVPSVVFAGELQDVPFYIMDYVDGHTFEQAIFKEGQIFSLPESLYILKKLLKIVIAIHQKGIVHRDLRIPNILIKKDQLYIIDFGLAAYINPNFGKIDNPKKAENHSSDLYYTGHFLLYLLYSNYIPTERTERSWQEELQLPIEVIDYIERLLLIRPAFSSAEEALISIPIVE